MTDHKEKKIVRRILEAPAATERLALQMAAGLKAGMVLALTGDLGAGKTAFTQALARGLGIKRPVTSPTFMILQEYYEGRLPLFHFDFYRLNDPSELKELGLDDYLFGEGICAIEWADRIREELPPETIWIDLQYGAHEKARILTAAIPVGADLAFSFPGEESI